ncbi:MAG: metallophosphoesterase [Endomicrobiales bacterium]|nr:metallophosphoesterase [Endomicrobiales bacterium]
MIKILAVSDNPLKSLENSVSDFPDRYKDIDVLVSCGDLDRSYVELISESIKKDIFFVSGNHPGELDDDEWYLSKSNAPKTVRYINGRKDMHCRVIVFNNYIFAGFNGSLWYNGGYNQHTEKEMSKVVKSVIRKVAWHRLQDKVLNYPQKEVIVLSHAPVEGVHDLRDQAHRGFKCFRAFIEKVQPLLWMHGHIHLNDSRNDQVSVTGKTTIVNVFGCKIIEVDKRHVRVSAHCRIDK